MDKKKAVALKYEQSQQSAPTVIASGKGTIAEKIIQLAEVYSVPIFKNDALASSLLNVEIGDDIPPKLYKAVAEVFVWLAKSNEKAQMSRR